MAIVIKCDPIPLHVGGRALLSAPLYKGAQPQAGDAVFIWFSETTGGSGLAAHGVIEAASDDGDIALTVHQTSPRRALDKRTLAPERDAPGSLGGLAAKLYRNAHNKIAQLDDDEAKLADFAAALPPEKHVAHATVRRRRLNLRLKFQTVTPSYLHIPRLVQPTAS